MSSAKQIAEAGRHLQVHWQPTEWQALERGLSRKLSRKALRKRASVLAVFGLLTVVGVGWGLWGTGSTLASDQTAGERRSTGSDQRKPSVMRLRDGSQLEASAGADWLERVPDAADEKQVELEVLRGRLRLTVVPHRPGEFRLRAGDVLVEVIGTVLSLERQGGDVSVSVESGRVKVTRGTEAPTFLGAGERRTFTLSNEALEAAASASSAVPATSSLGSPTLAPSRAASASPESSWQALARDGEYAAAYGKLRLDAVPDVPGELLLAADVARLSGHPAQAVVPLRRVTTRHASDPRASLAAFTLGRVYLEDLGNPRDAAQAFRLARTLQPGGPLVESALAREVEALARAGENHKAKTRAREYLVRYPNGTKRKLVQRHADEP